MKINEILNRIKKSEPLKIKDGLYPARIIYNLNTGEYELMAFESSIILSESDIINIIETNEVYFEYDEPIVIEQENSLFKLAVDIARSSVK